MSNVAIAGGGLTVLQSCGTGSSVPEIKGIVHYVLFWLREDLTEQEVKDFENFFKELTRIPDIKSLSYGRAAATHPRPVVDNSFSYNLIEQGQLLLLQLLLCREKPNTKAFLEH